MTSTLPGATPGAELAAAYGLRKVGGRPPLRSYVRQVWQRRQFCVSLARGRASAENQGGYLGSIWAFLTPLLWAVLYYFVFGILLHSVNRGIPNFAAYLVAGLFIYRYVAQAIQLASKCIQQRSGLITSLQFPRALVPLAYTTAELISLFPALAILFVVCLVTGEPIRPNLLLLPPTIALCYVFTAGVSLIVARVCYEFPDLTNLVAFFNRLLMYVSGVMFSLDRYGDGAFGYVMRHQPVAVYIELTRESLIEGSHVPPDHWFWAVGWALLFITLGLVYFWRAEAKYGRG